MPRCRPGARRRGHRRTGRLNFLGHLSEAAATALARAVGFGRAGDDDLARMAGHLSADTAAALGRRREISVRRRAAQRELEAAEQRLDAAEKRAGRSVAFAEVSAILEASAATRAEVELSYHVSGASWRPLYDLALDGERLAVSYLAEVTQQTGEDWPAVELVLSTTRRGLHQVLPELDPWSSGGPSRSPGRWRAGPWRWRGQSSARSARYQVRRSGRSRRPGRRTGGAAPLAAELGESGAGRRTGSSVRWPCPLTAGRARPWSPGSNSTPHSTTLQSCSPPRHTGDGHQHLVAAAAPRPARVFHDTQSSGRRPWRPSRGPGVRATARRG